MEVKIARVRRNITQIELRRLLKEKHHLGISPNKVVAIEKGDYRGLKYHEMIAISKVLDTTVQELFFND
ncbi:helix-turn-helix transcriptional regulator [Clostridium algidicarnis]|uniref:helix-turn-helix transcriptional regulator n=1 Tax=Clostridium algidicarnis TaxID=37659 RepID=UPI001C0B96BF|nr:helix-turn-helix transcriptional regulator [Clostridium algidicarnis]MBU3203740.1 helix-turn-helix transcriptional regulator [Clostridium algidicarnis]MBU3211894.1 helix-turn-helix transcriptional regulator [Clostridium algidicarnis]MBU3221600.1 helix-turn-helix transcriptional regulator [Clostridium algidicarnis]